MATGVLGELPWAAAPAPILLQEPLVSLPEGSELPVLVSRVDARYPDAALRMNLSAEVMLRIVVEGSGSVGRIDVLTAGPAGMTEAAVYAVRRWWYRPARVLGQPVARRFLDFLGEFLDFVLPAYESEGKTRLTIAIGCTGGYHRSIVIAEDLATWFRERGLPVAVFHRELDRA